MKTNFIVLGVLLFLIACSGKDSNALEEDLNKVKYRLTFTSLWNEKDHLGQPVTAHFSPIVLTVHDQRHTLFSVGELTGRSLEEVAEHGNPTQINKDILIDQNLGKVLSFINTKDQFISTQSTQVIEFEVSLEHSMVSFVTMVAPSPDWIVGLDGFSLYDGTKFIDNTASIDLYAYNAGTEEGDFGGNFSLNNNPTQSPTPIQRLTGEGFNKPFAKVTIQRI